MLQRLSFCRAISSPAASQLFSTKSALLRSDHCIYVSKSTNPYFNLSLEDWLFRHAPCHQPLLFLYRDEPCVVIGRNQNPWKEVNFTALRRAGIPFIRRRSGGGTVYHDLGNTNFSIHLPRRQFDRHATVQVALAAVRSLNIDAHVNDRNDICIGKDKVSGSAYKIVNKRAYHHGTMLISTRLDALGDLLQVHKASMVTKGVASVRSPVCNLLSHSEAITHNKYVNAVIEAFRTKYDIDEEVITVNEDEDTLSIDYIRRGMSELPTWEWAYGQTPEFTYELRKSFTWGDASLTLTSRHGIITSCAIKSGLSDNKTDHFSLLAKHLEGKRYGLPNNLTEGLDDGIQNDSCSREILEWLAQEMEQ